MGRLTTSGIGPSRARGGGKRSNGRDGTPGVRRRRSMGSAEGAGVQCPMMYGAARRRSSAVSGSLAPFRVFTSVKWART